jgi:L-threonylcarbamoyladenylate synthase
VSNQSASWGRERIAEPDAAGLLRASELLRRGSVCAFPTETVYGLGGHAFSAEAVAEIYRLKNRPAWNPLIIHVGSAERAESLARDWPDSAAALAERYWPGPLTLVVDRATGLPHVGGGDEHTIAIRVPAHPVAQSLLRECELPLAAPSANRSEQISPTRAEHVVRSLPDVPLVLDGGPCDFGIESTVVDVTGGRVTLLRPGALALRSIRDVVGKVDLPDHSGALRSPGLGKRHYAPQAKLIVLGSILAEDLSGLPGPAGVLTYDDAVPPGVTGPVELLSPDPREYAADLYAALHRLDDAGVKTIVALAPPAGDEWLAVNDRLTRAAR